MPFWIYLVIEIVISAASVVIERALAAKNNTTAQDFQGPVATAGIPVPVWWGVANVAPNTVHWGNLLKIKYDQWTYYFSAQHLLGWGVVNEIIDISFNGKSLQHWGAISPVLSGIFSGDGDTQLLPGYIVNAGAPLELRIYGDSGGDAGALFGGNTGAGGVGADPDSDVQITKGQVCMYWGFDDPDAQPMDDYLKSSGVYDTNCSRWPNFAYLRMGSATGDPFYIAEGAGSPPPMKLICRRTAWWDKGNTGADSPLGQTAEEATIRYDANPAEILFDILTHKGYGIGRDPANIDVDSFGVAAITLREQVITGDKSGLGISLTLTDATDAASVIQNILQTIDAVLDTNPVTGLLRLKLIRPDYTVEDLPVFDESNSSGASYAPSVWRETINEVVVTYNRFVAITDADDDTNMTFGFVDDVATWQDLANFQSTGRVRTLQISLPYVTDSDVANFCAANLGRAQAVPIARVSFKANRSAYSLMKGDPFVYNNAAYGIAGMVLRITNIDYGTLEDGEISIDGVQDVFSITAGSYVTPQPGFALPSPTVTDSSGDGTVPSGAGAADWGVGFY